jgi:Domain of unknown function (DUF6265)
MKQLFAFLLCCMALSATAQQKNEIPFEKLTGNWTLTRPSGTIMGETWATKSGDEMNGKSFMVKKGDTTLLETVQLIKKGNDIFYIPVANGQNDDKPVPFKLTAVKGTAYIFENPEHDFPKRIVYDFTSNTTLHAYIDDGTEKKRQDYYYTKQK